jgi:hypothetical protein
VWLWHNSVVFMRTRVICIYVFLQTASSMHDYNVFCLLYNISFI